MRFTINTNRFLKAINLVNRSISTTTPLPSLAGILMKAEAGTLSLTASDFNISISPQLPRKALRKPFPGHVPEDDLTAATEPSKRKRRPDLSDRQSCVFIQNQTVFSDPPSGSASLCENSRLECSASMFRQESHE